MRTLVLLLSLQTINVSHANLCEATHCGAISEQVSKVCSAEHYSGNLVYLSKPDKTSCYCQCSRIAIGTKIKVGEDGQWKDIQDFSAGDETILTLTRQRTWEEKNIRLGPMKSQNPKTYPLSVLIETIDGDRIVAAPEHPFLIYEGKLVPAISLDPKKDELVDKRRQPVKIFRLSYGNFKVGYRDVTTKIGQPGDTMYDGHLLDTAGVISGDHYAQVYLMDKNRITSEIDKVIPFSNLNEESEIEVITPSIDDSNKINPPIFEPFTITTLHDKGKSFFPAGTLAKPGFLKSITDPIPLEMAEYLIYNFKRVFPEIKFEVKWASPEVGAQATLANGEKLVTLPGGLLRHRDLGAEGLGLIIAHEIAHFYGGVPRYNRSLLSCEGHSDYWGALVIMREIWWGNTYIEQMEEGIKQLESLNKGIILPQTFRPLTINNRIIGTCSYPPDECRSNTYEAGLNAAPKPECADPEIIKGRQDKPHLMLEEPKTQ